MDKYMATKPSFVQGHLEVARAVAAGKSVATFDSTVTALDLKRNGQPIEFVLPADDPTLVFTLTAGIFKDAPHPNAAKLFLTWYMAKEQQSRTGVFSARADVPPPAGFNRVLSYQFLEGYERFVTNAPVLAALRQRFERYTGPVVNAGGVR